MIIDTAVLGGGLAGLSAGYHLDTNYIILEKEDTPGGLCRSVHEQGFTFDHAPHILYPKDSYTRSLIQKLLAGNLVESSRRAAIYHHRYNRYTPFPFQTHLYGLPVPVVERCLALMRTQRQHTYTHAPRTYYEWILRNFGTGMAEEFLVPYSQKLWTVHPREMNCAWLQGRVVSPSQQDIERGAYENTGEQFGFNTGFMYPQYGGIGALPDAFTKILKKSIRCQSLITKIIPRTGEVQVQGGNVVQCKRMITTLPLPELIGLMEDVPDTIRTAAAALRYNSVTCVNLGIMRASLSPYHWIYYHDAQFSMNRVSLPVNMSSATAPEGTSNICAEIAHVPHQQKEDSLMVRSVIEGLRESSMLKREDTVAVKNTLSLPYAYVIYDKDHRRNVDLIHGYLRTQRIIPAGRFGDWEYYNMDTTILSGQRAAHTIREIAT